MCVCIAFSKFDHESYPCLWLWRYSLRSLSWKKCEMDAQHCVKQADVIIAAMGRLETVRNTVCMIGF